MENITHSLLGATVAEMALPKDATPRQRTLFYVTGIVAANLPDADLLYTKITPAPLGYLLHHRGHTHTLAGIVALAVIIGVAALLPSVRALVKSNEARFAVLVLAALASHLIADSWNSYGVHALWPLTNRWYYGDAVFIAEPWLWALLGVAVVMNTRNERGRRLLGGALMVIPIGAAAVGLMQFPALIPIAIVAVALGLWMRVQTPAQRAWLSLVAAFIFVGASYTVRNAMRQVTIASNRRGEHRRQVDVILSPLPGNPLCWTALSLEEANESLYVRQSTLGAGTIFNSCGRRATRWTTTDAQSLTKLRTTMRENCGVRAWLQFGRAPYMSNGVIADARFGGPGRGNFSAMEVANGASAGECPPHLTHWSLPRADVLTARDFASHPVGP